MRIPVLLLSLRSTKKLGRRFKGLGSALIRVQPGLGEVLAKIRMDVEPEAYVVGSLFSAFFYGLIFFAVSMLALTMRGVEPLYQSLGIGIAFWFLFFSLHLIYPAIIMKKIAAKESKDLVFALREIMMDVNSGVPLFDAMKNVASADYGYVSSDFEMVIKKIERGVSQLDALRSLALESESEYMKRALWQMVNALETGASMGSALPGIVTALENHLYREIKDYSSNLNFLMLIYMLGAAVAPSLGITFLVLLSAFSELGVTMETIAILIGASALLQVFLIGYMSSTRPEVFGG